MSDHILGLMTTQIWQIAALAIIVAVVVKLAAKNRPHMAHALWMLVLIKCVTPPLWGHSLGVFSQLQARFMPDETTFLPDVSGPPASVPVAIAETLDQAPQIDVPDSEHGQPEMYEPDELLSLADPEPPEVASLLSHDGMGIELDEAVQLPNELRAKITLAESTLPLESIESDARWLRPGWLVLSGLAAGAIMTMFIMVFRCLRCLREIHRHRTTEFDDPLRERVQHLSRQLRIRRIPQIIVSDVLFGPAVLGLLRHTIVLPRCLFETAEGSQSRSFLPERTFAARRTAQGQTSAQRQSDAVKSISSGRVAASREVPPGRRDLLFLDPILAHELLHIRRGDLRTGTLQAIVQSLWWFHPAVWLSNRWLSREAERCCDEQVIAELGCSPAQYARSLLSVIECKHRLQPIPVFPGMKPVEITTQRMERIMSLKNGLKKRSPLWCWLTVVGLAIVVLPGAVAKPSVEEVAPNESIGNTEPAEKDDVGTPHFAEGIGILDLVFDRIVITAKGKEQPVVETLEPASTLVYPVADLVVLQQPVIAAVSRSSENENQATQDVVPASAEAVASEKTADKSEPMPPSETQKPAPATNNKADFAPLTELIKATVQPESWEKGLAIQVEEKTLSLIIQQTEEAHQEIQELLSQLRNAQDQNVHIQCTIFKLSDGVQSRWLEEQVSLHGLQNGSRWGLLPKQRCESFTQALLEQKPEVLSRPRVMTTSGQTATITVGTLAAGGAATGIRLEVTPHLLPDSNVIRLLHSFSIGDFADEMPQAIESLVGSGQTLLLLVDDPEDQENPDTATSQYLVMMTPAHIPQVEETVSGATPQDSLDAATVSDSPDWNQ